MRMNIELTNVIPEPLKGSLNPHSNIWNTKLTFEKGKQYLVDAQSGKGKSTFVQCLYGIRRDYEGSIAIDNKLVKNATQQQLSTWRKSHLSILFQDLRLFLDLTALENIELNMALDKGEYGSKIDYMTNKLQVSHLLDKKSKLLSYGERQRIALIRALAQPFEWILLDEPFSHLDKDNTTACYELILEVCQSNGAGIILTTLGEDSFIDFKNHYFL